MRLREVNPYSLPFARLFQEDGETLVLTETDELSRTYGEDARWSPNSRTPASAGARTSPAADRTDAIDATAPPQRGQPTATPAAAETPSPSNADRPANVEQVGAGAEQQIITARTPAGPRTTPGTPPLRPQHLWCFNDTGTHAAEHPRAAEDTVSRVINSPVVDSAHPDTSAAEPTPRSPGLAGGKVGRRNQEKRAANVAGPQEEPQLRLWGRAGDGGGAGGRAI